MGRRNRQGLVRQLAAIWLALALQAPGWLGAQPNQDITQMLISSYDLLEEGKLDQAQKVFEAILQKHPGEPLALNNLAAIVVKKGNCRKALDYLNQALPQSRGYKVLVNRVCDLDGVCLAFRPLAAEYGNQELEPLIKLNIEMIKAKLGLRKVS
jgi:tetratricopeptide (TPR) repeat protein